jgi:hypothetical protein
MTVQSTVIALLSASLVLVTTAATATLAVDRDRIALHSASDPASCPPMACSVVVKTETGGEPSRILAPTETARIEIAADRVPVADATP